MFAVISDTHFGDKDCGLVVKNECTNEYELGKLYKEFKTTIGCNHDYLVLLGDIFDFAVKDYSKAYEIGKIFFNQVVEDNIVTKGFIYLPGNHDFDLWNLIEYEANIINRLKNNKTIKDFKHSVPGIIDARDGYAKFSLYGISENQNPNHEKDKNYRYGGLYLDQLLKPNNRYNKNNENITFNIAYPNLYLFTEKETVMLSHGHYLGSFWSLFSEYGRLLTQENTNDWDSILLAPRTMKEFVSLNFPLNQLASSGIGQSGKLREIVAQVEHRLKENKIGKVNLYIDNLFEIIKSKFSEDWSYFLKRPGLNYIKRIIKERTLKSFRSYKTPRNNTRFLEENKKRFKDFYDMSVKELKNMKCSNGENHKYLKQNLKRDLQRPKKVIYGHTHVPSPFNGAPEIISINNNNISTYNTGGWLSKSTNNKGENNWRGAEIFFIDKTGSITSKSIKPPKDNKNVNLFI